MKNATMLLTGATGFLGGATLAHLRQSHPDAPVLLLVRGAGLVGAASRVRQSLSRFLEPAMSSCEVICGDLTDPNALTHPGLERVTHVLHLASNTSFRSVRGLKE
jgi:uncharacterized protein YbjT (DUF2867 family)